MSRNRPPCRRCGDTYCNGADDAKKRNLWLAHMSVIVSMFVLCFIFALVAILTRSSILGELSGLFAGTGAVALILALGWIEVSVPSASSLCSKVNLSKEQRRTLKQRESEILLQEAINRLENEHDIEPTRWQA